MKWIIFLAFTLSFNVFADFESCEDHYSMSTAADDGTEIQMLVPGSKVKSAGSWSPDQGEPPLSVSSAFSIAESWGKKNLTRYDGIVIDSISLKKYECLSKGMSGDYWYYFVDYSPIIEGNKLWGAANWLVIIMSGEVLEPVRQ